MKVPLVVAIDLGGSFTKIALLTKNAEIVDTLSIPSTEYLPYTHYLDLISNFCKKHDSEELLGIAIGATNGNAVTQCIENPANLPWKGITPICQDLSQSTNLPVVLTNDANAAALGEKYFGAAKDFKDFVYLTLGTGLGSGIFANNQLILGKSALAGELGHLNWVRNGRLCGCGRTGCVEKYISATAIQMNYVDRTARTLSVKEISEKAYAGENDAIEAFLTMATELGYLLADIQLISDPEAVILAGGIMKSESLFLAEAIKVYESQKPKFQKDMKILLSSCSEQHAALFGAASLFFFETCDKER